MGLAVIQKSRPGTSQVQDDADNDGILDREEQGPGGADPTYDGNGDGTPDSQQENVASFHTTTDDYVTLVSLGGMHLTDVQAVDNPSPADTPVYLEMPFGFIDFAITGITPGGAATVHSTSPQERRSIHTINMERRQTMPSLIGTSSSSMAQRVQKLVGISSRCTLLMETEVTTTLTQTAPSSIRVVPGSIREYLPLRLFQLIRFPGMHLFWCSSWIHRPEQHH